MSADFYDLFNPPTPTRAPTTGPDHARDPGSTTAYANAALEGELSRIRTAVEGTRNDALNRAAYSIGQLVAAGALDHDVAHRSLTDAARSAGLHDDEIVKTLASGLGAGTETPRTIPDPPDPHNTPTPTIYTTPALDDPVVDDDDDLYASWSPVDLTGVLDGTYTPEVPTLLPRADGHCLLYPGRLHSFHGESESGKSLIAQAAAADLLRAGSPVLYIDFESDHAALVGRLLDLGCNKHEIAAHFTYVRPDVDPRRFPHEREAVTKLLTIPYTLAIIDGVTDALGIFGASTKDNDEITSWMRLLPRTIAQRTNAAVVLIDHVTKDSESRGRFAIGGQAKMAALDGAAYVVEVAEALGQGRRGMLILRVAKDRPGGVRAHAGPYRGTDRTQEAVRVVVDSTAGPIVVEWRAPDDSDGTFRPTGIMERVSTILEDTGPDGATFRHIKDVVAGRDEHLRAAIGVLVSEKYVRTEPGPRRSTIHLSTQPYREARDPASIHYVTVTKEVENGGPDSVCPSVSQCVPDTLKDPVCPDPYGVRSERDTLDRSSDTPQNGPVCPDSGRDPIAGLFGDVEDVSCRGCFAPTPADVVSGSGRCPKCARNAGEEPIA